MLLVTQRFRAALAVWISTTATGLATAGMPLVLAVGVGATVAQTATGPASPFAPLPAPLPTPVALPPKPAAAPAPQATASEPARLPGAGKWLWRLGAGGTVSTGNTRSARINLSLNGERVRPISRWTVDARLLHARDGDNVVGEQGAFYTRYDKDRTPRVFIFNQGSVLRDRPANLAARLAVGSGVGWHLRREPDALWDVTLGLGYSVDRYMEPTEVRGEVHRSLDRVELLLGENSSHQLTRTTRLKQQLLLTPALNGGPFRAEWRGGVAVAMTERLHLTVDTTVRYNADPGTNLKKTDTLVITGVALSLD